MGDPSELNCPYCEKKYNNRGFLPKHIKQHHENSFLLDSNMSVMRSAAIDESCPAAEFNNHENPFWDDQGQASTPPPRISSTPSPPTRVPLCQNASNYIIKRGKTLPASFLTALLPAPGFLDSLNESLETLASPRLEVLQLSTSRMADDSLPLEPLQLPASPQSDELEVISQWAQGLKADVSRPTPSDTAQPPVASPEESLLIQPPDNFTEIPSPGVASLGDYLQYICGNVKSQSELIIRLEDVGRRQNKLIHQLEDKVETINNLL